MATNTEPTTKRPRQEKGGVIAEINKKIAAQKATKGKPNGKDFDETTEQELAAQEGRKPILVQGELPGQETPKLKDIITMAVSYKEARDARMKAGETEVERRTLLEGLMQKHDLRTYKFEGLKVEIVTGKEKAKVTIDTDEEGDE